MTDRHQSPSYPLRLPAELKNQVTQAAAEMGRSFNAEIIARLQSSFDQPNAALPFAIEEAISLEQELRGGTPQEAHIRLAKLAMAQGGTLISVTLAPGTTVKQFRDMIEASRQIVPPDASIVVERGKPG